MPEKKNKHLTIYDRVEIEKGLSQGESFSSIARRIDVSTSTVSREVKQNRTLSRIDRKKGNLCVHKRECELTNVCDDCSESITRCRDCRKTKCFLVCKDFKERSCDALERAPFVCGDCHRYMNCRFRHATYRAADAQLSYECRLVESREGISLTPEQLRSTVRIVRYYLRKGWSLEAIWASCGNILPVSVRTMYSYIEKGLMGLANIDLPKKVKYKPRKKIQGMPRIDRAGRSFTDFSELPQKVRDRSVQMDCVMGKIHGFKCVLTIHFPLWEFQLMILLEDHTCECVIGALDHIESLIGTEKFKELFGIILTDRGTEFSDHEAMERSSLRPQKRCRVYYCDPMSSCQKGSCEKNHELIRRILPKGSDLDVLTQYDIATVASHVNSYPRPSLKGRSPFAMANRKIPKKLLDELGIEWLRADEVSLKPDVITGKR